MGNWDKEDPASDWQPPSWLTVTWCVAGCIACHFDDMFRSSGKESCCIYSVCIYGVLFPLQNVFLHSRTLPNSFIMFYINVFVYSFWTLFEYFFPLQNVRTSKVSRTEKTTPVFFFPHQPPKSIFFGFGVKKIQYWEAPHTLIIYYMIVYLYNLVYIIQRYNGWSWSYPYHIMFIISIHGCQDPHPTYSPAVSEGLLCRRWCDFQGGDFSGGSPPEWGNFGNGGWMEMNPI